MSDYTEYSSEGFFSRMGSAIVGVLIGIVLFIVSFPLLFWNEGRAVDTAKGLTEGAAKVVSIANPATVDAAADGKLVHLSAKAETADVLKDERFGVEQNAIRLERDAEMYQWVQTEKKETKKKVGGGTETKTEYSYDKKWSKDSIDSSAFKVAEGHRNPAGMAYKSERWSASDVKVGAYRLPASLVQKISGDETITPTSADLEKLPAEVRSKVKLRDGYYYVAAASGDGSYGDEPQIGDIRVQFKRIKPGPEISLIAQQTGNTFEPYTTTTGTIINRLDMGTKSASAMFQKMQDENATLTWILRLVGFIVMAVGIGLCFRPAVVLFDILPIFGDFASMITGVIGLAIAFPLSLITIAIAWVAYRPLVGIPLLAVGVLGLVGMVMLVRSRRKPASPAAK